MIPLRDDTRRTGTPVVNVLLIAANALFFAYELSLGPRIQAFVMSAAFVPAKLTAGGLGLHDLGPGLETALLSMFLHGGWAHLGGNMLFLWIFGDNLEKVMGHVRYLIFYVLCGLAAGLAQIASSLHSSIPSVGASGAISGVLAGYLLLFPKNRIRVLTRVGVTAVPAFVMLGLWILIQFVSGLGSLAQTEQTGGVAYMAHIGGFVAGLVLVKLFAAGRPLPASV